MTGSPSRAGSTDSLIDRSAAAFVDYREGEEQRMSELVDLLTPILWHTARSQGASASRAEEAVQTAWLRLVEHADSIREPRTVLAWLMTTVRREAIRAHRRGGSTTEIGLDNTIVVVDDQPTPDAATVLGERQSVLWAHVTSLSARCQELLRIIAFAQKPDYANIAEALGMPVGSIGPTRGRCLDKLRTLVVADAQWEGHAHG